jgi:RimJ/RimL family protein N-acetyltransferase
LRISEALGKGIQEVIKELGESPEKNIFAIADLLREPEKTRLFLAREKGNLSGYILLYRGMPYRIAMLETKSREAGEELLGLLPWRKFVIFVPPRLLSLVQSKFAITWSCEEEVLNLTKDKERLVRSGLPVRLKPDAARNVFELYPERGRSRTVEGYRRWIANDLVYGVFLDGNLTSVCGTYVNSQYGSVIGGLYTSVDHRNIGYGAMVVSAVAADSLRSSSRVIAYVVSTNSPSLGLLKKLGFTRVARRAWVDVGTGVRPLMEED